MFALLLFTAIILALLIADIKFFHSTLHPMETKEALWSSGCWISLALLFNLAIYFFQGSDAALSFLTGFLLEKALSVDNLFVFLLIFSHFQVPAIYSHYVLFLGIMGALVTRAIFIMGGIALASAFHWIFYLFGTILIIAAIRLLFQSPQKTSLKNSLLFRLLYHCFPLTDSYEGKKFFVKKEGRYFVTPLAIVLIAIEATDLFFALDSIPAILAITLDPFIVYTSNIFAVLGLRSLYFALANMMQLFCHLHYGLAFILFFIGIKMFFQDYLPIPLPLTLLLVLLALFFSFIASLFLKQEKK